MYDTTDNMMARAIEALENMRSDVRAASNRQPDSYLSGMRTAYNIALLTLRSIKEGQDDSDIAQMRFTLDRVLNGGDDA